MYAVIRAITVYCPDRAIFIKTSDHDAALIAYDIDLSAP